MLSKQLTHTDIKRKFYLLIIRNYFVFYRNWNSITKYNLKDFAFFIAEAQKIKPHLKTERQTEFRIFQFVTQL